MAEDGGVDALRIARVDPHDGDLLRVGEPHVPPGRAAVGRLVDAVAHREVGTLQPLAAPHVEDPRVRRRHGDRADRLRRLAVEDRLPGAAGVGRFPYPAVVGADVECVGLARHPHRRHRSPAAEGADHPPAELRVEAGIEGLGGERAETAGAEAEAEQGGGGQGESQRAGSAQGEHLHHWRSIESRSRAAASLADMLPLRGRGRASRLEATFHGFLRSWRGAPTTH